MMGGPIVRQEGAGPVNSKTSAPDGMRRGIFRLRAASLSAVRAIREFWYRSVRVPLGYCAWWMWGRWLAVPDGILSRRNVVARLPRETCLHLDPRRIDHYVADDDVRRQFFLWSGAWEERVRPLDEHPRHRLMADVWAHREALEGSRTFAEYRAMLAQGRPAEVLNKGLRLDSETRILDFLRTQLALLVSLHRDGFIVGLAPDELYVAVGREGQLYKANAGRKRFTAARILGMPALPVRVAYVHPDWLRRYWRPGLNRNQALRAALRALQVRYSSEPARAVADPTG